MDPISTAIFAALAKLAEPAVKDAYDALKKVIAGKLGNKHNVLGAIGDLEKHPASQGRAATLAEEVAKANIAGDADIAQALQNLVTQSGDQPRAGIVQTVSGNSNIVAGGNVSIGTGAKREG
ncbi:MAG TPA: hypothetical protein VNZ26_09725 [Vicinamibacterales bacterium]|jgi:hypothetical protein|nr:hypothetical protein [Vicinamibacterales bacterium]